MITLSTLPKTVLKKDKKIGRGSNRGKNSGHGNKGQIKRAGKTRVGFEGGQKSIIRRTPKSKGYGFNPKKDFQLAVLTVSAIERSFKDGDTVTLSALKDHKLIDEKTKKVRIINTGKLSKKIQIETDNIYLTSGAKKAFDSL